MTSGAACAPRPPTRPHPAAASLPPGEPVQFDASRPTPLLVFYRSACLCTPPVFPRCNAGCAGHRLHPRPGRALPPTHPISLIGDNCQRLARSYFFLLCAQSDFQLAPRLIDCLPLHVCRRRPRSAACNYLLARCVGSSGVAVEQGQVGTTSPCQNPNISTSTATSAPQTACLSCNQSGERRWAFEPRRARKARLPPPVRPPGCDHSLLETRFTTQVGSRASWHCLNESFAGASTWALPARFE